MRKSERPCLGPVSTNHDQRVDLALAKKPDGPQLCLLRFELLAALAAEKRSASLDDIAYVAGPELNEIVFEQAGVTVTHTKRLPTLVNARTDNRPHRSVHPGRVTSTGKYGDPFHST